MSRKRPADGQLEISVDVAGVLGPGPKAEAVSTVAAGGAYHAPEGPSLPGPEEDAADTEPVSAEVSAEVSLSVADLVFAVKLAHPVVLALVCVAFLARQAR